MILDMKRLAGLSEDDLEVLAGLSSAGAATPIDLAVRLRWKTEEVVPHLRTLLTKGLVDVKSREKGIEREIYLVSGSFSSLVTR